MSDTETTVDDVTTDVETEIDTTDETPERLTEDDYFREKARREKAEKALVEQKRRLKELESKSSDTPSDVMTKAEYAMEKFLDKNPELSEYTKELSEYTKKGLSLEDAKTLVLNSDKAKQNREKTNSLGLSD
jgi:type II secretory pathway component PulF